MNGVFDQLSNKKYDDVTPNPAPEDGVDIEKCLNEECRYNDIEKHRCVFETCILKQFPLTIPYHKEFTNKCKICGTVVTHIYDEFSNPLLTDTVCPTCYHLIRKMIYG